MDGPNTGFAVRVKLIADSLSKSGHIVIILRLPNVLRKNTWAGTIPENVELIELSMPPGLRLGCFIAFSQLLRSIAIHLIAIQRKVDIIQAENTTSGDACTFIKWTKTPVIIDLHGAAVEEALFERGESFKQTSTFRSLVRSEKRSIKKADLLLVVSEPMIDLLKSKYPELNTQKIKVIPTAADAIFFDCVFDPGLKAQLGFEKDDIIFVYSGGAQSYQCIDKVLSIFSKVAFEKQNVKLLVLSIEKEKISQLIKRSFPTLDKYIVLKSLDKADVAKHLQMADLGFLLRDNDILNQVSCPTKFAEYAACGVSVIATQTAGHAPALIARSGAGLIVNVDNEDQALEQILAFLPKLTFRQREKCKEMAAQHLHWDQAVKQINYNQNLLING